MDGYLKQSTAFTFRAGPFVDATDGVTPETGLTIAQADIQISKAGGAFAQTSEASPTTTHDSDGYYQCPLTTTDVNTVGQLKVQINMSGAAPVWHTFMVLPANVYDSLVAGSDYLDVSTVQIEGSDATDQINAACDAAIETYGLDHLVAASVTGTDVTDDSIIAKMVSSQATADWDDFVNTTDALQAIRDSLPTEADNSAIAFIDTVSSYSSDTITLTTAPTRADEFNTLDVVVIDGDTDERYSGYVTDTTLTPNTIVLSSTPAFTPASGDRVVVYTTRTNFMKATTDSILNDTDLIDDGTSGLAKIATDVAAILDDTGTNGVVVASGSKSGYALSATGLNLVIPPDPDSTLPTLGSASLPAWIGCFAAVMINEANATSSQISIRNTGDSADLITYASITDDGTTLTVPAGS